MGALSVVLSVIPTLWAASGLIKVEFQRLESVIYHIHEDCVVPYHFAMVSIESLQSAYDIILKAARQASGGLSDYRNFTN